MFKKLFMGLFILAFMLPVVYAQEKTGSACNSFFNQVKESIIQQNIKPEGWDGEIDTARFANNTWLLSFRSKSAPDNFFHSGQYIAVLVSESGEILEVLPK